MQELAGDPTHGRSLEGILHGLVERRALTLTGEKFTTGYQLCHLRSLLEKHGINAPTRMYDDDKKQQMSEHMSRVRKEAAERKKAEKVAALLAAEQRIMRGEC